MGVGRIYQIVFLFQNFGGSKSLNPSRRPPLCPSMHTSQIKLTRPASDGPADWNTHYTGAFVEKPIIPVSDCILNYLKRHFSKLFGSIYKHNYVHLFLKCLQFTNFSNRRLLGKNISFKSKQS